jgi:hypothetical protein
MAKPPSYFTFVWKDKTCHNYLIYGLAACILQFIIFKILYPFPDFFNDSYWYVFAAYNKLDISFWPIGYSKFLSGFHYLTHSDTAVIAFQYFFLQLTALNFAFTLLYFFNIKSWIQRALLLFIICNPLTLYLANTIASDTIFGALTLLWLSQLLWIILKPRRHHLVIAAIAVFLCFTIRNTTYYYPLITTLTIILSRQPVWQKLAGIALPIVLIVPFVLYTQSAAYKVTGTRTFSLLTGWQVANNVLYYYDHIKVDSNELPDGEARQVNRLALKFFKETTPAKYEEFLNSTDGNIFIINYQSPLKQYFVLQQQKYPAASLLTQWGMSSVAFEPFGRSIVAHHPWAYFRYFVSMNTVNYLLPQISDLGNYSNNRNNIEPLIASWFDYPSTRITCISHHLQGNLSVYRIFFFFLHLYFLAVAALILAKVRSIQFTQNTIFLYCILTGYILANAVFSAAVTINLLRYQYIPMYVLLLTDMLLTENIFRLYADKPRPELVDAPMETFSL